LKKKMNGISRIVDPKANDAMLPTPASPAFSVAAYASPVVP